MNKRFLSFVIFLIFILNGRCVSSQNIRNYERLITMDKMESDLSFIASDAAQGRESGTSGNSAIEQFIVSRFRNLGLKPYNWTYTQSFNYEDSIPVRNVVGYLPAIHQSSEYIVVGAHYDHIGVLSDRIYNGADDNASGVTALLALAEAFQKMKDDGAGPRKNILFVAFDGKELDLCGSRYFVEHLNIPASSIICAVNMDIIGANLVPPGINDDYIIALGENTIDESYRGYLSYICRKALYKMDLDLTFYGSKNFTKMIYETGDQYPFVKKGIPAMLFTSAFNKHTLRPTDTIDIINFPLLRRRTLVIFNFINKLCSE